MRSVRMIHQTFLLACPTKKSPPTPWYAGSQGRTKKMATEPSNPFVFWSSAEDGTVRQVDRREAHTCTSDGICSENIFIDLNAACACGTAASIRRIVGVKSIEICASRPQYMVLGCSDPYARLYDRRFLRNPHTRCSCVQHLAPPGDSQRIHSVNA